MAAPKGNKFALHADNGRAKTWETPGELEADISEYFEWCEANPIIRIEYNGKDATRCEVPTERPPTIEGLALRLGTGRQTLLNYEKKKGYEDYFDIVTRAKRKIIDQQITFGLAGVYNSNTLRLILINNSQYKDKVEQEQKISGTLTAIAPQIINTGIPLSDSEKE